MNKDDFRRLPPHKQAAFIKTLSKSEQKVFLANPNLFLYPKQVIEGNTRYILLRCGRRFGKSWSGGAYIAQKIYEGAKSIGLCGPIYADVNKVMAPSIRRWFYGKDKPSFNNLQKTLVFPPGSKFHDVEIHCFTSDKEIRGYGFEYLWCDEVGAWLGNSEQIRQRFYSIDTCVSEGRRPQTIITTTPITIPLFHEWKRAIDAGDTRFKLITGTMFDNPFLSEEYKKSEIAKYGNTRLGRQELFGELLEELEGALFTKAKISSLRSPLLTKEDCHTIIVAVDPAVTSNVASDETGIVVIGTFDDAGVKRALVLDDFSGRYTPKEWNDKVYDAFQRYDANYIIAEKNQGGDLVKANITAGHPELEPFIKGVWAKKNKMLRAEPVSNVLDDGKVLFSREFPELEKQLIEYVGTSSTSPDRMDAFVYGITELLIKNQDLDVFKSLQRSADITAPDPMTTFVYTLGIDIKPTSTTLLLGGYNKITKLENRFHIFSFKTKPMNVMEIVNEVREIMKKHTPIYIAATKEYVSELKKYNIPVRESSANDALVEAVNSDIINNRIVVHNGLFHSFSRLIKSYQYDGEVLDKAGRFVLMQEDGFINAFLNSFCNSHHFVHRNAPVIQMTMEEKLMDMVKKGKLRK